MARGKPGVGDELTPAEEGFDLESVKGVDSQYVPDSFEEAMAALQAAGIEETPVIESPWKIVDKAELVGREFYIFGWQFNPGDYGPEGFVSVRVITPPPNFQRLVFNDGSTGILQGLRLLERQSGHNGGYHLPNGLRKSEYYYDETDGRSITSDSEASKAREAGHTVNKAATYYLA